jgi:hypothetical protein
MTEYEITVNALIYEQDRAEKVDVLCEERGVNRSDLIRELIDEEFERSNVELEEYEEDEGETSLVEEYDPNAEYSLQKDELKELAGEVEKIDPSHVRYGEMPSGQDAVLLVASMTRFNTEQPTALDIQSICEDVGLDSDYYLETLPRKVFKTLEKRYTQDDNDNNGVSDEQLIEFCVNACVDNINDLDGNISGLYSAYTDIDKKDRWQYYDKADARTNEFVECVLAEIDDRQHPYVDLDWHDNLDDVVVWFKEEGESWAENEKVIGLVREEIESWLVEQEEEETDETEETEEDTQGEENKPGGGYLDQLDQAEIREEYEEKEDYYTEEDRSENHEEMRQQNQQ